MFSSLGVFANWDLYLIVKFKEFCPSASFNIEGQDSSKVLKSFLWTKNPNCLFGTQGREECFPLRTRGRRGRKWGVGREVTTGTARKPDSLSPVVDANPPGTKHIRWGNDVSLRAGVCSYSLRAESSPTPVPSCGVQTGSGFYRWIFATDLMTENTDFEIQLCERLTPKKEFHSFSK